MGETRFHKRFAGRANSRSSIWIVDAPFWKCTLHRSGKEQVCFQKNEELNVTDNEIKVVTGILLLTGYYLSTSSQRILWEKFLDKLCANLLIPSEKAAKNTCFRERCFRSKVWKLYAQDNSTRKADAFCNLQIAVGKQQSPTKIAILAPFKCSKIFLIVR